MNPHHNFLIEGIMHLKINLKYLKKIIFPFFSYFRKINMECDGMLHNCNFSFKKNKQGYHRVKILSERRKFKNIKYVEVHILFFHYKTT